MSDFHSKIGQTENQTENRTENQTENQTENRQIKKPCNELFYKALIL